MEFSKVCYITSKEPYLVDQKYKEMRKAFEDIYIDLNVSVIKQNKLFDAMETWPLMAEKKMLLIRDITENDEIAELITKVPEHCCILIKGELDKRKKLYKNIKKVGEIIDIPVYKEKQMTDWIVKRSSELNMKLTRECATRIIQLCGIGDMYLIENELIKLSSTDYEKITLDIIDRVVIKSPEYTAFTLTDAISRKNKVDAYKIIKTLAEQNEYLPLVLSLIFRNFAILKMLKTMREADVEKAGIHSYSISLLRSYKNNYTESELDELMSICQATDFEMKNGVNHRIALEKIVGII